MPRRKVKVKEVPIAEPSLEPTVVTGDRDVQVEQADYSERYELEKARRDAQAAKSRSVAAFAENRLAEAQKRAEETHKQARLALLQRPLSEREKAEKLHLEKVASTGDGRVPPYSMHRLLELRIRAGETAIPDDWQ